MRVRVDRTKCQAYGNCVVTAPTLFDLDDSGYAFEIGDGIVEGDDLVLAETARVGCPAQAIVIE